MIGRCTPWLLLLLALAACASHPPVPDAETPVEKQEAPKEFERVPAGTDNELPPSPPADPAPPAEAAPAEGQAREAPAAETPPPSEAPSAAPASETKADGTPAPRPPYPPPQARLRPCGHPKDPDEPMLDETKRRLQETVCGAALWFDGLFGEHDAREIDAARGSYGKLELSGAYSDYYGSDIKARFNARIQLPNIKKNLNAFVGRDAEDSIVRDRSESFSLRNRFPRFEDHDETIAGLGYTLPENYTVKTEFRSGVRFSGLHVPKVFAQVRLAMNAYSDESNLIDLRLTPFVNTHDGLGTTGTVDVSHVLSDTRLLRWSNVATITQKTAGLDWLSTVILYQGLSEKRAIAYETFIHGATAAPVPLVEYGVQTIYRQPLSKERLFGSLILGYSFPKENPWEKREGSWAAALVLELPFGDDSKD